MTRSKDREERLAAARELAPVVAAGAAAGERAGTLPKETVSALAGAGLFGCLLPAELGGRPVDPVTAVELVEEIAYQDGAAGWCLGIQAVGIGLTGAHLPEAGAREVFADPSTICAGGFVPRGSAEAEGDGYRVRGRFQFGSGCRHAEWIYCCCPTTEAGTSDGGDRPARVFLVPASQVVIHDNWQVAGLEGTASCDFSVDALVPTHRSFSLVGAAPQRGGPCFRLPLLSIAYIAHSGFGLGIGRRALDEISSVAETRLRLASAATLAHRGAFQRDLGRSLTHMRAARALVKQSLGALWDTVNAGRDVGLRERGDFAASASYAYEASCEAADLALRAAGASALFRTEVIQRCFRDVRAGLQHVAVTDEVWERIAQVELGLEPPPMML